MIQHFVQEQPQDSFEQLPKLVHVCCVERDNSRIPRAMHNHENRAEFVYIVEGIGNHIIGNRQYETHAGDLLIFNSGVPHEERAAQESNLHYFTCGITNLKLKGLEPNFLTSEQIIPVIRAGEYGERIQTLFTLLNNEVFSGDSMAGETARYLMIALLTLVLRAVKESGKVHSNVRMELGTRIKQYVDQHYLDPVSMSDLSEALGISQFYLSRVFKERTGYSPMQYIINRRIGRAQSLLISTDLSVTKIAEQCGYDNPNYFNLLFKKTIGMAPGAYRKAVMGEGKKHGGTPDKE